MVNILSCSATPIKKTIIPTLKSGGAENVLVRLVEEFDKLGVEQTVITLSDSKSDFYYKKVKIFCNVSTT